MRDIDKIINNIAIPEKDQLTAWDYLELTAGLEAVKKLGGAPERVFNAISKAYSFGYAMGKKAK